MILAWSGLPWYWALVGGIGWEGLELIADATVNTYNNSSNPSFWHEVWIQKGSNLIANIMGYGIGYLFASIV
jgi:hypothetical protein